MPDPHTEQPDPQEQPPLGKPSLTQKSTKDEAARFLQAEIVKLEAEVKGLSADKLALVQEYVTASDEDAPEKLKKNIRARMPKALERLDTILEHGSDGVAAGIAKWIIDRGLMPEKFGEDFKPEKELAKLLEGLKGD